MTLRRRCNVQRTLVCAVKFWSGAYGAVPRLNERGEPIATSRDGVRKVVRAQGFTPSEVDAAESAAIRSGLLERGYGVHATLRLTALGRTTSCKDVKLAPWTDAGNPGAALDGRRRRR